MTRRSRDREAGDTLVELLVAVVILGLAVTLIVGAMMTMLLGTDSHRKQAVGDTVVRAWAEDVTQAGTGANYVDCASASSFSAATLGVSLQNYTAALPVVSYWNGSSFVTPAPCTASSDHGMQKVSLNVTLSDNRDSESVDVILYRQASS